MGLLVIFGPFLGSAEAKERERSDPRKARRLVERAYSLIKGLQIPSRKVAGPPWGERLWWRLVGVRLKSERLLEASIRLRELHLPTLSEVTLTLLELLQIATTLWSEERGGYEAVRLQAQTTLALGCLRRARDSLSVGEQDAKNRRCRSSRLRSHCHRP